MYKLVKNSEETVAFIKKYLRKDATVIQSKRDPDIIKSRWYDINEEFKLCDEQYISDYINEHYPSWDNEKYHKFTLTYYWIIIGDVVKLRATFLCQLNYSHESLKLNVHHGGYKIHGKELQNINLLICICRECHDRHHLNLPIRVEVPPIMVETSPILIEGKKQVVETSIFDTPLITEKYIGYQISVLHELLNKKIGKKV